MKRALITGITGQDGSYLAELLLAEGLRGPRHHPPLVSSFNTERIDHIYQDPHEPDYRLRLIYGDLNDASSLNRVAAHRQARRDLQPRRAEPRARLLRRARVHRRVAGLGTLRLLEAIRETRHRQPRLLPGVVVSEMFGRSPSRRRRETTPFHPRSPYAVRQGLRLLDHRELPRGLRHVHRLQRHPLQPRVARAAARPSSRARSRAPSARIKLGLQDKLLPRQPRRQARLGLRRRLRRGDVADAPAGQARRLRHRHRRVATPCASSSTRRSARSDLDWQKHVEIDPRYFRPAEVDLLLGDPARRSATLGWKPKVTLQGPGQDDGATPTRKTCAARSPAARPAPSAHDDRAWVADKTAAG